MSSINYTFEDRGAIPALLEEGAYEVEVKSVEFGYSQAGNEKADLQLNVLSHDGKTIYDSLTFTEKAFWRIDQALKSLGIATAKGESLDVSESLLVGKKGWVNLVVEEWNDRKRNKVGDWLANAPSGGGDL
jgi:hypothetical protein